MKTSDANAKIWSRVGHPIRRAFLLAACFLTLLAPPARASILPPGAINYPIYNALDYWWFDNDTNWTSTRGEAPLSFTNISTSDLGDGPALVVDSPGSPAWLQFGITNTDGSTNLTVAVGTVMFWYAPNWSSTDQGGSGPGEWGRLLEVGGYTTNSSFGLWSLYVDPAGQNIYFSAQTNDFSGNFCTYLTAPIAFITNYWHFITFTYSATNTALYIDGELATNGPAITNCPSPEALANGFFIGSDSNGVNQAEGLIDDLYTYNTPVDPVSIAEQYLEHSIYYFANPFNFPEILSAGSLPSTNFYTPDAITGTGYLGPGTPVTGPNCVDGITTNDVWLTNVLASVTGGSMNITFTIEGGGPGIPYDVFANSELVFGAGTLPWAWMGQGFQCETYTLTGMPTNACFLILGTPLDSDGADLTDAYQALVTHTSGNTNSLDGVLIGWEALLGLNPNNSNLTQPSLRSNYGYTGADWLNAVTGARSGSVTDDPEGNILSVSQ